LNTYGTNETDVIIIGEGITGLCVAYWLKKRGIKGNRAGKRQRGRWIRWNPCKIIASCTRQVQTPDWKRHRSLRKLVSDLKLESEFVYAHPEGKNRYILRDGILHSMPLGPGSVPFDKTLFSRCKFRVDERTLHRKSDKKKKVLLNSWSAIGTGFPWLCYRSICCPSFCRKAGTTQRAFRFSKLYALEESTAERCQRNDKRCTGKENREPRKRKTAQRPFHLWAECKCFRKCHCHFTRQSVILNAKVTNIRNLTTARNEPSNEPDARRYLVEYLHNDQETEMEADSVVFAIPAYDASPSLNRCLWIQLACYLLFTTHAIVSIFFGGEPRKYLDIGWMVLDSWFHQRREGRFSAVYGIHASLLIVHRQEWLRWMPLSAAHASLNWQPWAMNASFRQHWIELKSIMQLSGNPVYLHLTRWQKSIPQYEIGYQHKIDALAQFEESLPGIVLAGNYRGGIFGRWLYTKCAWDCKKRSLANNISIR